MKKFTFVMLGIVAGLLFSISTFAQTAASPFVGKWDVFIKGTPNGDVHLFFTLAQTDGKLTGTYTDPESKKEVALTKVEEVAADKAMTMYFTIQNYDVNLKLTRTDDTHAAGSLMGMFDATAEKVKQ